MLRSLSGPIHLSVAGGCGGTTLGLQYARGVLSEGNHVVWICDEIPDGERFSQIFCELSRVDRLWDRVIFILWLKKKRQICS